MADRRGIHRRSGIAAAALLVAGALIAFLGRSAQDDELRPPSQPDGLHPPVGKRAGMYPNDWFHRQRASPAPYYPGSAVERAIAEAYAQRVPITWGPAQGSGVEDETPWVPSGPVNIGGRITAVAVHPGVPVLPVATNRAKTVNSLTVSPPSSAPSASAALAQSPLLAGSFLPRSR